MVCNWRGVPVGFLAHLEKLVLMIMKSQFLKRNPLIMTYSLGV